MSIRLSEKHGINPSLDCCIICGEAKGVAILGRIKDDKEAPHKMVTSLEPCDACKEKYLKNGVMLVRDKTHALMVIKEEAFKRIFKDHKIPAQRIAVLEGALFDHIMGSQDDKDK